MFFRQFSLINPLGAVTANIQAAYSSYLRKPVLEIQPDQICVTLPALENVFLPNPEEEKVFRLVRSYGSICATNLLKEVSVSRSTLIRILNRLIEQKLIVTNGAGPSVCYSAR